MPPDATENRWGVTSEIEVKIDECIKEISQYRYFSPEVETAIKSFERLKEAIKNLSRENIDEFIRGVDEAYRSSQTYSSIIPKTVENLRFIKEWLEKKRMEL